MAIAADSRSSEREGSKKIKMSRPSSPDNAAAAPAPARKKDPGVRIMGSRIYDSTNGKTCHQCRQKTMDFAASCTKLKKGDRLCTIKFCCKCLLNRYGENAEEVEALGSWICPKCRGICNCSFCMKKKGQQPTGILVHTAKATGYSSVLELLDHRGSEGLNSDNAQVVVASKKRLVKETVHIDEDDSNCLAPADGREEKRQKKEQMTLLKKFKKESESGDDFENSNGPQKVLKLKDTELLPVGSQHDREKTNPEALQKVLKLQKHSVKGLRKDTETIVLPQGTPLVEVAGIEFSAEDVGPALQFLEFCKAFSKVLHIKRGQSESILQEIAGKCPVLRPSSSSTVRFHMRLLSLIRKDRGESMPVSYSMRSGTSWLEAFGKCISESECHLKEPPPDFFNKDTSEYNNLDMTTKLKLLNFLCDETLTTGDLRSWIEQENTNFHGRKKEIKEKVIAAKRKVQDLRQKLKAELAKPMLSPCEGAPLSVTEHNDLISKIRTESEKAHAEFLESADLLPKKKQRADAVRTEPFFLDGSGNAYWKLGGSCSSSSILQQDIGKWDLLTPQDKWYFFDEEKEKLVEKLISSLRNQRPKEKRIFRTISVNGAAEGMQGFSKNSTPPNCLTEGGCGTMESPGR